MGVRIRLHRRRLLRLISNYKVTEVPHELVVEVAGGEDRRRDEQEEAEEEEDYYSYLDGGGCEVGRPRMPSMSPSPRHAHDARYHHQQQQRQEAILLPSPLLPVASFFPPPSFSMAYEEEPPQRGESLDDILSEGEEDM